MPGCSLAWSHSHCLGSQVTWGSTLTLTFFLYYMELCSEICSRLSPDYCTHIRNPTTLMQNVNQSFLLLLVVHFRENACLPTSLYQVRIGCQGEQTVEDPVLSLVSIFLNNTHNLDLLQDSFCFHFLCISHWVVEVGPSKRRKNKMFPRTALFCSLFCSFCLSRTRKLIVEVDLFIYLPANVTFISETLNVQWGRCLWKRENAKFSLKFPVKI